MIGMTNVARRKQSVDFDGLTFDFRDGYGSLEYTETGYDVGEEPIIYYSNDAVNWTRLYSGDVIEWWDKIYLKGDNPNGIGYGTVDPSKYINLCCSGGGCKVYGNLYSLLDNGDGSTITSIPNDFCFVNIFKDSGGLVDASNLELSSMNLTNNCYRGMFSGCYSLESVPILPATTLANYCYAYMFYGCNSLTTAMTTLPATTRAEGCYQYMFSECYELLNAPTMFFTGTTGSTNSCEGMFEKSSSVRVIYLYSYTGSLGASNGFRNWVNGVSSSGNFMWGGISSTRGADYIPSGWRIIPR